MSGNSAREDNAEAPRRGRPRSERARVAILEAAADLLLAHGMTEVSMDAVAERAGVSKSTIYRWWPTKEMLALDAVHCSRLELEPVALDTGSLSDDLLGLLLPMVRCLRSQPYGRLIAAFVAQAHSDPNFADHFRAGSVEPQIQAAGLAFRRATARGEILASAKVEMALDLVYGPIYYRLLYGHAPLSDNFVIDLVDDVVASLQRQRSGGTQA